MIARKMMMAVGGGTEYAESMTLINSVPALTAGFIVIGNKVIFPSGKTFDIDENDGTLSLSTETVFNDDLTDPSDTDSDAILVQNKNSVLRVYDGEGGFYVWNKSDLNTNTGSDHTPGLIKEVCITDDKIYVFHWKSSSSSYPELLVYSISSSSTISLTNTIPASSAYLSKLKYQNGELWSTINGALYRVDVSGNTMSLSALTGQTKVCSSYLFINENTLVAMDYNDYYLRTYTLSGTTLSSIASEFIATTFVSSLQLYKNLLFLSNASGDDVIAYSIDGTTLTEKSRIAVDYPMMLGFGGSIMITNPYHDSILVSIQI